MEAQRVGAVGGIVDVRVLPGVGAALNAAVVQLQGITLLHFTPAVDGDDAAFPHSALHAAAGEAGVGGLQADVAAGLVPLQHDAGAVGPVAGVLGAHDDGLLGGAEEPQRAADVEPVAGVAVVGVVDVAVHAELDDRAGLDGQRRALFHGDGAAVLVQTDAVDLAALKGIVGADVEVHGDIGALRGCGLGGQQGREQAQAEQ